ncbi:5-amino-6-(5-phosphoribosylamino)uracil reductase [Saccharothrix tamanrassetensis]|uniref:5-amino-6-(5-phosphoribosylamino)uracil reductase n=1 Tax=Saccharothrix tamanrassetensis TaxID=1051531 RepID=A0A841CB79_9PSEU|nr:dihydrofolate reductase family protein [Saccharothrix tamanrassetensis]MBB5953604.1 5-amino-6-(5-phosphoribosylamino)uracil reductase [Saccharothrix tamanrassetensis]
MTRPHVLLSVAVSLDGYIDDRSDERFPLSNAEDFDHVDRLRAESGAILVGAQTVRRDNPRLLVNSAERRAARVAAGRPEYPLKVTVTHSGALSPDLRFWHHGGEKLVYTTDAGGCLVSEKLAGLADVVSLGASIDFATLLDDLGHRGVDRLMVEGGGRTHTAFLAAGLADEIRVAVAPMLIGQATAPRFVLPAEFPGGPARRFHLADVAALGDVAVLRYFPKRSGAT